MLKDPWTEWQGSFPYDALAEVGITPHSSMQEVRDASFVLMMKGTMTREARAAWDELRFVERRLVVDFLLYDLEVSDVDATRPREEHTMASDFADPKVLKDDFRSVHLPPADFHLTPELDQLPETEMLLEFDL